MRISEALSTNEGNIKWFVVYTRPRWEKKVARELEERGVINYCPLNKVHKQWSDRKKVVLEPLFRGYVFVQLEDAHKWDVKEVDGILNFVYWLGKPAVVRDADIEIIKKFLQEFSDIEVTEQKLDVNTKVVIKQGVMMNYKGIILELLGNRARVRIDSMGLSLNAVFEKKNLLKG